MPDNRGNRLLLYGYWLSMDPKTSEIDRTWLNPQQYVDQISERFRELQKMLNVSNNRFIRTTDVNHEERAQIIWKALAQDIYKGKYSGWYDVKEEEFIPENKADKERMKPDHPQGLSTLKRKIITFFG